jgi:hypothetical protein
MIYCHPNEVDDTILWKICFGATLYFETSTSTVNNSPGRHRLKR